MSRPSQRQIRRRRRTALVVFAGVLGLGAYLVLAATVFAPVDRHGARLAHIEVHSEAVGRDLGLNVIVPPDPGPKGERSLLVFLHGRGGNEGTFNDAVFRGLPSLQGRAARSSPSRPAASTATGTTAPTATGKSG